jgi:hypothetical protein
VAQTISPIFRLSQSELQRRKEGETSKATFLCSNNLRAFRARLLD